MVECAVLEESEVRREFRDAQKGMLRHGRALFAELGGGGERRREKSESRLKEESGLKCIINLRNAGQRRLWQSMILSRLEVMITRPGSASSIP
ncbi:hypothetical protein F1880_001344 [Penicillium rolfsii]|nr:hypothetical protein F1880_001344 [Penicillium rolfsii]